MRLRKNVLLGYAVVISVGLLLIASFSTSIPENVIQFNIISPNAEPNDIKIPSAVCFAKTTTSLLEKGFLGETKFIREDNSPFLADNPQFTLNSIYDEETQKTVIDFGHYLKMRCEVGFNTASSTTTATGKNQLICEDPNRSAECVKTNQKWIEVRPSSIEVQVFAENSQKHKDRVYLGNHQIKDPIRLENGQEKTLLFINIPGGNILKYMDQGTYNSLFEFKTSGILNMVMQDFSIDGVKLSPIKYYIGPNDIPTYFNLKLNDNVIGKPTTTQELTCTSPQVYDQISKTCITPKSPVDDCKDKVFYNANTDFCNPQPKNPCNAGYALNADKKCELIQKTGDDSTNGGDPKEDPKTPNSLLLLQEYLSCGLSLNISCILNMKFLMINAMIFLLVMGLIIASIASKKREYRPIQ